MATYDLLDSVTLSSSAASVTFSSIDQSYRDLVLVCGNLGASTASNSYVFMRFNGSSATDYNRIVMDGNGSTTTSASWSSADSFQVLYALSTSNESNSIYQIMDYSASDKHKSVLQRFNKASQFADAYAHRWASTSAITSLNLFLFSGTFNAGSTFYLYGVAA